MRRWRLDYLDVMVRPMCRPTRSWSSRGGRSRGEGERRAGSLARTLTVGREPEQRPEEAEDVFTVFVEIVEAELLYR